MKEKEKTPAELFIDNLEKLSNEEIASNFKTIFTQALALEDQEQGLDTSQVPVFP